MQEQRANPDVLSITEAAAFLRCSVSTVQRLTRAGLLTPYHIGQRPRYPRAMLERFQAPGDGHDHPSPAQGPHHRLPRQR